jgi:hypothetical protein
MKMEAISSSETSALSELQGVIIHKTEVFRAVDVPDEIRTGHIPNTSQKSYQLS